MDEVLANPEQWQGKRLQVHGFAKDVRQKPGTLEYRFDVENNGRVIRAYYTGIAPDTFMNDAEVVIRGTLQPDGTFQVVEDGVMAKCPSKYEPQAARLSSSPGTE